MNTPSASSRGEAVVGVVIALLCASLVGSVLCLLYGESPARIFGALFAKTWGDSYGFGQVLYKATLLSFSGLAVALAFRVGLFNVGVEGQLLLGAFATAFVGAHLPSETPWIIAFPVSALAGALAGALWAVIPGLLRAYRGAHEVISAIMLNFIAGALLNYLLTEGGLAVPESVHTAPVVEGARLSRAASFFPMFEGSALNTALLVSLLAGLGAWFLLERTKLGLQLRAFGLSPDAAATYGASPARSILLGMALSGALAGLGGVNFVSGYKGYFEEGFSAGAGFMGIAVALLAKNRPGMILPSALLFATLSQGGLAMNARIPKDLIDVLQGVVILAAVAAGHEVRRWAAQGRS
jgi:simple sugar transport system permease protein